MELKKTMNRFLTLAGVHLGISTGVPVADTADESALVGIGDGGEHAVCGGRRRHKSGNRQSAEKHLHLARLGKVDLFRGYPGEGEKIVFYQWASPNPEHRDQKGNPSLRLQPRIYYKDGVEVVRFPAFNGPTLSRRVLWGRIPDPESLQSEYRDELLVFARALDRAMKDYCKQWNAARKRRSRKSS
ncbi:MAG: hypothetical protein A2942_03420 [Candidatus Lloydbacteria bacterium RIFCSPLOWO2_01_FULL_50_20]|uniref:Uncharacterized protein n=1 Tax=Candidatus Lloydbacteria bacterium RIFCSPLOWO2_01_FULL_50_20 TaxID=1798665 RepID=A0A1G2DC54_9BACT|nr:MAG: hypothetical protein A2942_03420 [Candidatus Lloydbacteria bacterium RIFCSPLOWO2_01_FULL_50_20]